MKIDGVFSGGGMRSIAMVGAYQVLEEKGIQITRLAGTSGGSVIAAFIAAGYSSQELKDLVFETKTTSLLDERRPCFNQFLSKWLLMYWRMGLYKGDALEGWIGDKLAKKGVRTFLDLPEGTLRLIASDLTSGRLLVLPDDLLAYGIDLKHFPLAKAIRMSCSIPYFFEPVKLKTSDGVHYIVDGGVLSGFPMWLFGDEKTVRPVIGVTLKPSIKERKKKEIRNAFQLYESLFATMKEAHDTRYIEKKYAKNVIFIPTSASDTVNFDLLDEKKHALIEIGRERTIAFLHSWSC
jgi:NTE family protein